MCFLRDWGLCLCYSVIFECLELTFQFVIPEFQECWWDSAILDVSLANMLGLYLGHKTVTFFQLRSFDWESWEEIQGKGLRAKLSRSASQFLPYSWSEYHWNPRATTQQYLFQHGGWLSSCIFELNSFFQMNLLEIPPTHPFCMWRQTLIALAAIPGQAEYYEASTKDFKVQYLIVKFDKI